MKITLTSDKATLTARTVNGLVTIPIRRTGPMLSGVWRQFASHSPRPRYQTVAPGIQQLAL